MTNNWNIASLSEEEEVLADHLARELNLTAIVGRLLVLRGITSVEEAQEYFHPSLSKLHDPFLMRDMDLAVKRLNKAVGNKERILIYGDYDVDGTTAVTLVYKFLRSTVCSHDELNYYIPDRYEEGYGISYRGIDFAHEWGARLIIVLDCGIKAIEKVAYARVWVSILLFATIIILMKCSPMPWQYWMPNERIIPIRLNTCPVAVWALSCCRLLPRVII